jgi:hypothetical protein
MKRYIFVVTMLAAYFIVSAQGFVPQFEMPFYFVDSLGNRDTVWVGYDDSLPGNGTGGHYNEDFDGPLVTNPFDSVFDVRVFHYDDRFEGINDWMLKHIVLGYETIGGSNCGFAEYAHVAIQCKYPPLHMYYDSTLFGINSCRGNAAISNTHLFYVLPNWWGAEHQCLAVTDSLQIDIKSSFSGFDMNVEGVIIENGTVETLNEILISFKPTGPCPPQLVGISEPKPVASVFISPNPAQEKTQVQLPKTTEAFQWALYNAFGQAQQTGTIAAPSVTGTLDLDLSQLPTGLYFISLSSSQRHWTGSVVVQE